MCNPLALAAIAVAGTAVDTIGQIQAANAQAKAINSQLAAREKEIDREATAEINDRLREARREQGRIMVAAGEAGLSLESGGVEALLMDSAQQAGLSNSRSLANKESRKDAARTEAQARMPAKPTALGAGLQIALAGAKAYGGASKKT